MKEKIKQIFNNEKEFDLLVEEILLISDNEVVRSVRKKKMMGLIAQIRKVYLGAHYDAVTDSLTGCFNKKHIEDLFHYQYAAAKRNKQYFSIAVLDIDYLKYINDTFGHSTGDKIIKRFAQAIAKAIRENDMLFRYGGDEFVFFCSHSDKTGLKKVVKRIEKEVSKVKVTKDLGISVTIGYKVCNTQRLPNMSYNEVFISADKMLYDEKHKRKPPTLNHTR